VVFLAQSRVPALDQKAQMGIRTEITSIAFDKVFELSAGASFLERVLKTTANWSYTNWKGMTFGILFGAAVLTLLRALPVWGARQNGFLAALQGLVGGAPLGVCVNCATPIAQGLQRAGVRIETMLAVMSASPTLNFIVITMMFTLFDAYFVATKIVMTIIYVAFVLPGLVWLASRSGELRASAQLTEAGAFQWADNSVHYAGWWKTSAQTGKELAQNLLFLLRITLPLMIFAGFLGALLVEAIPLESLTSLSPGIGSYLAVAFIGALLPVPIAFDVILTSALLAVGFPVGLAMTLFFSLGIFSVFPAMIIGRDIGWRLSALVLGAVVVFSCLTGVTTQAIHDYRLVGQLDLINQGLDPATAAVKRHEAFVQDLQIAIQLCESGTKDPVSCLDELQQQALTKMDTSQCGLVGDEHPLILRSMCRDTDSSKSKVQRVLAVMDAARAYGDVLIPTVAANEALAFGDRRTLNDITISRRADPQRDTSAGRFVLHEGASIGISRSWQVNATDFYDPFLYGKGITSNDINRDGYPDLAMAMERGAYVYLNDGKGGYVISAVVVPPGDFNGFVVALVDVSNDGWPDLFMTGYGGRRVLVPNEGGSFSSSSIQELSSTAASLTMAAGFADIDQDNDLDVVLGNWSHGTQRNFRTENADNEMWLNDNGTFSSSAISADEPRGSTLTVLLSDISRDGSIDIVIGNDQQPPDVFYFSEAGNRFYRPSPKTFPGISFNTMSYESADFDNDLKLDLFSTDMADSKTRKIDYCSSIADDSNNEKCLSLLAAARQVKAKNIGYCFALPAGEFTECMISMILKVAVKENLAELCERIPQHYAGKKQYCERSTREIPRDDPIKFDDFPSQVVSNKLLMGGEGNFRDVSDAMGAGRSNWSWNARGVDLDNDRYLDIYVGTGFEFITGPKDFFIKQAPNVVFHNQQGQRFLSRAADFGLDDVTNTTTYSLTDYDVDGDMDIVTNSQVAGTRVYENQLAVNHSITFVLQDELGNRQCIGCQVIVTSESGSQLREVKASGGFMSYDEPIVQFGLGEDTQVSEVEIRWSTGQTSRIGELDANYRYKVVRQ
jgi:uncharacterized membrane protein YraQ (UPF0718 family)